MSRPFALFDPEDGRLFIRCGQAVDGDYLIWVDDILIGRMSGAALRKGVGTAPTYRLHAPGIMRLQPVQGAGWELRGIIWIRRPSPSSRVRTWTRGRSVSHRRAIFLASDGLPAMPDQREIVMELQRVFGGYFDSFATAILRCGATDSQPEQDLTVDAQIQCDITGLEDTDVAGLVSDSLAGYAPKAVIPLDAAAAVHAQRLAGLHMLEGPWLGHGDSSPAAGIRWQVQPAPAQAIEMTSRLTVFASDGTGRTDPGLTALLHNRLGLQDDDVLPDTRQSDLISRLAELGEDVTVLIGRGTYLTGALRMLRAARFTSLEMETSVAGSRHRSGLPITSFDWEALRGRWLVYLGQNQALDSFLAGQCGLRGQAYRSAFTVMKPGAAVAK